MEKESENRVSIKDIAEPISYFLAGSFLIGTAFTPKSAEVTVQSTERFACVVGGFLILSGFIFMITNLPSKRLANFREKFKRIYNKYVYSIVFLVTIAMVVFTTIDFANYPPLFYIGFAFLIMVLLQIMFTIGDMRKLLATTAVFNGIAIYLLWIGADKNNLTVVLSISLLNLLAVYLALRRSTKPKIS